MSLCAYIQATSLSAFPGISQYFIAEPCGLGYGFVHAVGIHRHDFHVLPPPDIFEQAQQVVLADSYPVA